MARVETIHSVKLLSAQKATEKPLHAIPSAEVSAKLSGSISDVPTRSAHTLRTLTPEQLILYPGELPNLLTALNSQWQKDQKGERP